MVDKDMNCSWGGGGGGGRTGVCCGAVLRSVEGDSEVKSASEKSENAVRIQGDEAGESWCRVVFGRPRSRVGVVVDCGERSCVGD